MKRAAVRLSPAGFNVYVNDEPVCYHALRDAAIAALVDHGFSELDARDMIARAAER